MLKLLKEIDDKKIEKRSVKAQEKFADQCMTVSTSFLLVGFAGMFALLGNGLKHGDFLDFLSAVIVFIVCLTFSMLIRKEAFEVYDRVANKDNQAPKSPKK